MTDKEFSVLFDRYMAGKRDEMRKKYDRVLPSGEYIFNRFDKAPYLNCGEGSSIYDTSVVMGDVEIGDHVWVGPYTLLDGSHGKLQIGVSGGVEGVKAGAVTIGSNTVIGSMSMIGYGVTIGSHCVVGANSYVNADVPDQSIVAGNPAKLIGRVVIDEEGKVEFVYDKNPLSL